MKTDKQLKLIRKCPDCGKPIKWNKTYGYQCPCGHIKYIK